MPNRAIRSDSRPVADMKAYSSEKRRQGDGQIIAGPAHYLTWASTLPDQFRFEIRSG